MRAFLFSLFAVAVSGLTAIAQPVIAPTPADPVINPDQAKRLDELLKNWSKRTLDLKSLATNCKRTVTDPLVKKQTVFAGELFYQRPDLARIELINPNDKEDFEKIIFKAKNIFDYSPREKIVRVQEIAKFNPNDGDLLISMLWGMKVDDAKKRFKIRLGKETETTAYIIIEPVTVADKQDFKLAELAIWTKQPAQEKANVLMMPRRIWYQEPSNKSVSYEFSETVPDAKIDPEKFTPRKPKGWEIKYAVTATTPKE
jgi:TIGR03009 family protein